MIQKPTFEQQDELLTAIKAQNAEQLSRSGIAGRALEAAGIADPDNLTPRVSITAIRGRDTTPEAIEYNIVFMPTRPTGTARDTIQYVKVAEDVGGLLVPRNGFDVHDVLQVQDLVDGLKLEKELGDLPDLSSNLLSVFNPKTAMRVHRQATE